jgi:glycosyltransferase involved in cell wall biosynthesis
LAYKAGHSVDRETGAAPVVTLQPDDQGNTTTIGEFRAQGAPASAMTPAFVAAIILTKNEERDLPQCLNSLHGIAGEVYVVDSGSTDRTVEIAHAWGATVLNHAFPNYAAQLNWALDNINTEADWIFRIDADERVSPLLRESFLRTLPTLGQEVAGVLMPVRVSFLGRHLRWGDTYPMWLLRMWRRGKGRCEDTWMDEHMITSPGEVRRLPGDLIHEIPKNLSEWTRKHDWYAERECQNILNGLGDQADMSGQARRKRLFKKRVYLRLPLFYRAWLYWFYRYFLRLGFLDGKEGLIYHSLQAFWYRFLVDAKLYELGKPVAGAGGGEQARRPIPLIPFE